MSDYSPSSRKLMLRQRQYLLKALVCGGLWTRSSDSTEALRRCIIAKTYFSRPLFGSCRQRRFSDPEMDRCGLSPLEGLLAALARPAACLQLPATHRKTDRAMSVLSNSALEDLQTGTVTHVKTCSYAKRYGRIREQQRHELWFDRHHQQQVQQQRQLLPQPQQHGQQNQRDRQSDWYSKNSHIDRAAPRTWSTKQPGCTQPLQLSIISVQLLSSMVQPVSATPLQRVTPRVT